jgi:hypothetical protein
MYISRVVLKNIRSFEKAEFDFINDTNAIRKFALILGDNSAGKTTVLRSIAIGLCDESGAASLLNELWGDFMRDNTAKSVITVEFRDRQRGGKQYKLTTTITTSRSNNYSVKQVEHPRNKFPWKKLFVCGYGASRGTRGQYDYDEYAVVDSLYTLFNYDFNLQQPELALRRQIRTKADERQLCAWLEQLLLLKPRSISLSEGGIMVKGDSGPPHHIASIGDGYQATITWVADLLGWALLARRNGSGRRLSGIVIIDEIEQHLHPKLQRQIVSRLRALLPNVQFIGSTHSALCAAGLSDLKESDVYLAVLKLDPDCARSSVELSPMPGWRYDQILTSEAFGLPVARDVTTQALMEDVQRAYQPGQSNQKSATYKKALARLRAHSITAAENNEERQTRESLVRELQELNKSVRQQKGAQ